MGQILSSLPLLDCFCWSQPPFLPNGKEDKIRGELRKGGGIGPTLVRGCRGPTARARGAVSVLHLSSFWVKVVIHSVIDHCSLCICYREWPGHEQDLVFLGSVPYPIVPSFPGNNIHLRIPDQTQEDQEFKAAHPLLGVHAL